MLNFSLLKCMAYYILMVADEIVIRTYQMKWNGSEIKTFKHFMTDHFFLLRIISSIEAQTS